MIQGPSNTDLRTNTLRILARIVAKAILQKSITDKELFEIELSVPDIHTAEKSMPGKNTNKRLKP